LTDSVAQQRNEGWVGGGTHKCVLDIRKRWLGSLGYVTPL